VSAIFNITERGYYVVIWFLQGRNQDFQGMLFREEPGKPFQIRFRFRVYADDKTFEDSNDVKQVLEYQLPDEIAFDEEKAIADVEKNLIAEVESLGYLAEGSVTDRLWIRGNWQEFLKQAQMAPWMHLRAVAKDQA
jgi:hypothetical protein